jgi:hypothetical protein
MGNTGILSSEGKGTQKERKGSGLQVTKISGSFHMKEKNVQQGVYRAATGGRNGSFIVSVSLNVLWMFTPSSAETTLFAVSAGAF